MNTSLKRMSTGLVVWLPSAMAKPVYFKELGRGADPTQDLRVLLEDDAIPPSPAAARSKKANRRTLNVKVV
ncbi:hypothetical protein BJ912DRAFT_1056255 [Pholiota molesta]|nr:hypothetical protein BJ912DRAFT_1056255 [Pholiota molesta]